MTDLPTEPADGTWLCGPTNGDGDAPVFHRDDAEGHFDPDRPFHRRWWDHLAASWVDWPTVCASGGHPDTALYVGQVRPSSDWMLR
jgi:hypothetical protein